MKQRRSGASQGREGPPARRRVTQEAIDRMTALRRQGFTFRGIGSRLGCSERTVRRYVGKVEPQLHLPEASPPPEVEDARQLRDWLARWFSEQWYRVEAYPRPRDSVAFLAESNRLIQERLCEMDQLTLALLRRDRALRLRFVLEALGPLYDGFRCVVEIDDKLGTEYSVSVAQWRPAQEAIDDEPPDNGGAGL